jgi:hypothetical protein
MYELHFEDETGLRGKRLFELRLVPDPVPVVRLERPAPSRDVLDVLPVAELPLEVAAEDAQYGLRSVFVEYRTGREEGVQRIPLHDPATFRTGQVGPWGGPAVLGVSAPRWRLTHLEFSRTLRLASLRHPDGSPLKEGDVVVVQAEADDFDDVSVGKEPGRSHQVEIRVVGREGLEVVLNQEQARVQQELVRLRERQREAIQKVSDAEGRLKKGEKLKPDDLAQLLQAEQLQQQIRERVGNHKEGLRAEVARVLRALKQNGLENSAARFRMGPVQEELDRLADRELEQIEPRLTNARQLAELTDEKARAERRAQLEQRAREAEGEVRAAEESANKREDEADRAEQRASKADDERERTRQRAEARRGRERAQELRGKTRELREQAARDRAEAAREPEEAEPRQALADTRKHQEEVEKTLNDLLARLEPWTSSREIKGEANRLLQEQRGLQGQVEKLMQAEKNAQEDRDFFGKSRDELPERLRAELDNVKDGQRRLEERTDRLLNQMKRVGEQRAAKDPETAQELKKAAEQAEAANVTGQMKTAARQIEQNQLGAAQKRQQESAAGLEQLARNLEDRREAELDRLAKKLRQAEKNLAELEQEQERLAKKVREARKIGNKAERQEALKQLAREQQELRKKAEEAVQQLSRLRAERAREALEKAGGEMGQADRQLSRGEEGQDEQEEALDRLREARQEVERAREQAEEELGREQMARLADVLRRLKERQEGHNREAERIQRAVLEGKRWTRGLRGSLMSLADNQKGLAEEAAEVGRKDLGGAPVFARLLKRSAEAMEQAGGRLGTMVREVPGLEDLPDPEAGRLQHRALRDLEQLVAALKSAAEMPPQVGRSGGKEGGGNGGGRPAGDAIPPLAQLKLLRAMQQEVNQQTEAFKKKHPEPARLNDKDRAELEGLRREQKDVADLLDELIRPEDESGDAGGEKQ